MQTAGFVSAAQFTGRAGERSPLLPRGLGWLEGEELDPRAARFIASVVHIPGMLVWHWGSHCAAQGTCVDNVAPAPSGSCTGCRAQQSRSRWQSCWWRNAWLRRLPWRGEREPKESFERVSDNLECCRIYISQSHHQGRAQWVGLCPSWGAKASKPQWTISATFTGQATHTRADHMGLLHWTGQWLKGLKERGASHVLGCLWDMRWVLDRCVVACYIWQACDKWQFPTS